MENNTITRTELRQKLGNFVRVEGIASPRSYESVRNQYEIIFENGNIFQSYDTLIGARVNGKLYLTDDHTYSKTTAKYCKVWCRFDTNERQERLADGRIGKIIDD